MTLQPDNSYRLRMIKVSDIIGTPLPAISGNYVLVNICKNGRVVLVLGPNGIYTSDNYGLTWKNTNTPSKNWYKMTSSEDGKYLAAITITYINNTRQNDSIYTSDNYGDTWTKTSPEKLWEYIVSSYNGSVMYAIEAQALIPFRATIYKSVNYGTTWNAITTPSTNIVGISTTEDGKHVYTLSYNEIDNKGYIYTSDNYGDTWTKTNAPLEAWRQISSSKDNQYIYAIEYYGKLYRYHGNSWDIVNTTNLTMFRSSVNLKTSENGSILLITTFDYIYISNDYGNTWKYLHEINVTIPKMTLSSNGLQLFSCEYESDKILIGGFIIPTVTTSYSKNNNDLSNLFASYSSMSKAPNTGYKLSNGKDFSDIFDPILGNNKTTQTNYIASNGKDLCDIFSPK